jgi:hypothetical protein
VHWVVHGTRVSVKRGFKDMKKVSFSDIHKARRWVLPVGITTLGFVAVAYGQSGINTSKANTTHVTMTSSADQTPASPAPTVKPDITVNGTKIPTDKNGSSDIVTPGGKAHVEVSGGQTRLTTNDNSTHGDTSNAQTGNVNLNVDAHSTGGSSWNSIQSYGTSTNDNGSSWSSNSTSVYSTSSN